MSPFRTEKNPKKYKPIVALALNASHNAEEWLKSLAHAAIHESATKEEIMEAIWMAQFVCWV
ncbi:MAG: carboxymuconolactone decarboxylase family protein [Methanosarcinaceae archaeon]|nr:carboxymuconolactone decarboxylase family protein [Methanosarcinaceae archaeon]